MCPSLHFRFEMTNRFHAKSGRSPPPPFQLDCNARSVEAAHAPGHACVDGTPRVFRGPEARQGDHSIWGRCRGTCPSAARPVRVVAPVLRHHRRTETVKKSFGRANDIGPSASEIRPFLRSVAKRDCIRHAVTRKRLPYRCSSICSFAPTSSSDREEKMTGSLPLHNERLSRY